MRTALGLVMIALLSARAASANPMSGYAVFSDASVSVNSNVSGGLTGSNHDVTLGSSITVDGTAGGGNLLNTLGGATVNGPSTFNGSVLTGGNTYIGPINAGADVNLGAFYHSVDITARGNVTLAGASDTTGNILLGGNFTLGGQLNGGVIANGSITNNGKITGKAIAFAGASVNPVSFTPVALPPAAKFTPGTLAVNSGVVLTPGPYGDVRVPSFDTLTFSAGTYMLNTLTFNESSNLELDLTGGPITILVAGDVNVHALLGITVKGPTQSVFEPIFIKDANNNSNPNPDVEPLASRVLLEALGNVNLNNADGSDGGSAWFGTIYATSGSIAVGGGAGFAPVIGSLLASDAVTVNPDSPVYYVGSDAIMPEPASLGLLAGIAVTAVLSRRWRAR